MTSDQQPPAGPRHDDDWLTDLFGRHSGAVLGYARRRLDSAEDAEDVVVEVFATAWRRRDAVPDEARPWLYATAANVIAHVIRTDARRTRLGTRLASVSPLRDAAEDPTAGVVDALVAGPVVSAALDDLSEADAELLRLWAWEQLEPQEIAQVLCCSPGTARTRLHRARTRLREALALRGVTDATGDAGPPATSPLIPGTRAVPAATTATGGTDPSALPPAPLAASSPAAEVAPPARGTTAADPRTPDDDQEAWR